MVLASTLCILKDTNLFEQINSSISRHSRVGRGREKDITKFNSQSNNSPMNKFIVNVTITYTPKLNQLIHCVLDIGHLLYT